MKISFSWNKYLLSQNYRRCFTAGMLIIYISLIGFYFLLPHFRVYSHLKAAQQQNSQTKAVYVKELQENQMLSVRSLQVIQEHEPITAISNAVSLAAAHSQTRVLVLAPGKLQLRNNIYFQPAQLELQGQYHAVVVFIQQLHIANNQILLQNFSLTKSATQPQELQLKLQVECPYL